MTYRLAALLLFLLIPAPSAVAQVLVRAHAHNDYEHERPLFDALAHGFNSIEADVHLVDGELLVAHDPEDVRPGRTLEHLYLEPLRKRVRENGGRVYPGAPPLLLLVDVKTGAEATYRALREVLGRYRGMLTRFEGDAVDEGAVTVVVSGNRARALMAAEPVRLAAYDGRLPDLDEPLSPAFIPLVSAPWYQVTLWRGEGPLPDSARTAVDAAVRRAHAQGARLRFWGTPDEPAVWRVLYDAGVDLLNADDLGGLRTFLLEQRSE